MHTGRAVFSPARAFPAAVGVSSGAHSMGPPHKPSTAGCVGRGGARKRVSFPPVGGNETKRTLRRRWGGASRRTSDLGLWPKSLMPGQFICPEQIKSRLEGSRRGPPRRELDAPPAAQEKAIGYTGPPTEPSTAGRLGSGGARKRLRNGRQAVPKTADFATTRRCRTRPTNPIRTRAGLFQPGPCMCPYLFT